MLFSTVSPVTSLRRCRARLPRRAVLSVPPRFSATLTLAPLLPLSVFSCTYELPILYLLCFDIHASDGGYRGALLFTISITYALSPFFSYSLAPSRCEGFARLHGQEKSSPLFSNSSELFCAFLHFFALSQNSTLFVSSNSELFRKNTRGMGGRCYPRALRASRSGGAEASLPILSPGSRKPEIRSGQKVLRLLFRGSRVTVHWPLFTSQNGPVPLAPHGTGYLLLVQEGQNSLEARPWHRPGRQQPISARGRQTSWQR
jgi:hypothetical protein